MRNFRFAFPQTLEKQTESQLLETLRLESKIKELDKLQEELLENLYKEIYEQRLPE